MFKKILLWFARRDQGIERALDPRKKIKIEGILFEIRKLNPLDYLAGFKAISSSYELYGTEPTKAAEAISSEKIKKHYVDIFTAAVISPQLTRKKEEEGLWVDALFNNWELCEKLYLEIITFTYGKKKLKLGGFQKKNYVR